MAGLQATLQKSNFQQELNGGKTDLFFLTNDNISVAFTNYGARIVALETKDQCGKWVDVVLGFDNIQSYLDTTEVYHGAVVGRYANRIALGAFTISGEEYQAAVNNGRNHLHGGSGGFHNVVWTAIEVTPASLSFSYRSIDGEEGYPGNVNVMVTYRISGGALQIVFEAVTDKDTVLNLTNHAYFNLNGSGRITEHLLQIHADHITPIDEHSIPTGELARVDSTAFDFRSATAIGSRIHQEDIQLKNGAGYDHNFVLNKKDNALSLAATATGDRSGIILNVLTTEPGMQLYTGNFMQGQFLLRGNMRDDHRTGFCLETQHFPDSPNQPNFPSTVLKAGMKFSSETVFSFSAPDKALPQLLLDESPQGLIDSR